MKLLHGGRALFVGLEDVNPDDFPDVEVIGCNMTGTEHLDGFRERGIPIVSLKGETEFLKEITSTAEHTIGLIIAILRNYKRVLQGNERVVGNTPKGKTLGIIGNGRIGAMVGQYARAFGMSVSFADKLDDPLPILEKSDVVTLHIPLPDNEGFLTREMVQKMKPSAVLINTSRSRVIADGVLLWALENKVIAGAAVDFTDDDGLVRYAEFHDNLILTPHIGGATHEDMAKTEAFIISKLEQWLNLR